MKKLVTQDSLHLPEVVKNWAVNIHTNCRKERYEMFKPSDSIDELSSSLDIIVI